ncbi:MAG TPA: MarR family winged helix-turn-helix transcriptional regulator [Holophagaceae bacterium]|nr:MarR family winged helix-turn-helix transcriptional regulator [Holophagaceae bacterium]
MQDSPLESRIARATLGQLIAGVRSRIVQVCQAHVVDHKLTAQQFWALVVLHEKGSLCLRELAEEIWCDEPTASRMMKALVRDGWVQARPDPSHGRRLAIRVAPTAELKVRDLHQQALMLRKGLKAGLSAGEEAILRTLLARLLCNLDALEASVSEPGKP